MRKPSLQSAGSASISQIFDNKDNYIAQWLSWCNKIYDKLTKGETTKSAEEQRLDKMAEIIRTYRGVVEEEEEVAKMAPCDRPIFDIAMSVVIVLNTFIIGLETDNSDRSRSSREWYWALLEFVFVVVFVGEVAFKMKYHGRWWPLHAPMNFFCTLIAFMAAFDFVILFPMRAAGAIEMQGVLRMISLCRIIGLLRVVRVVRQHRSMEELQLVLQGMVDSFQTIIWVVILITIFLYICSIITTKVIGQNIDVYGNYRKMSGGWDHEELFGTVGRSMCTLLQVMTLDSWSSRIARHVMANQWYMSFFFLIFLLFATHGLLNVVVSVIVQHTLQAAQANEARNRVREERARKEELSVIKDIFELADEDGSGDLDLEEFLKAVQNPEVKWRMNQLGIPENDAVRLFGVIDGTGTRTLKIKEFINGCNKLKGPAMSKDLLALQAQADTLAKKMDGLSSGLADSEKMMSALDEVTLRISRRYIPAVRGTRAKIAHNKGGAEPVVPPPRQKPGQDDMLSFGNRPTLPKLPNLLN